MAYKINYRPEIDGLRAIAVVSVILYHAQIFIPNIPIVSKLLNNLFFKGGFIGVDIFFVISGYLITSIILKELIITGNFSFKYFYERRIRRILPGLLFFILLSFPLAWFVLLPSSFVDLAKAAIFSIGFTSNFYFYFTGFDYFTAESNTNPLLHTWALSLEEQYYIFFPVLIMISFKFFKKYLLQILIICLLISLGISEFSSRNYPEANFYLLHTRIWELIAGSLLAYLEINRGYRSKNKLFNQILPFIGIILIVHSILFFDKTHEHPSLITLSPIIGACLLIWFTNKNEIITKILSTKLFVGIGLISYSLYLFYLFLFTFVRLGDFVEGYLFKKILIIIIIFVISIFSYFFIEKPARNKNIQFKSIITFILLAIVLSLSVSFFVLKNNGFEKRFSFNIQGAYPGYNLDSYKYYKEAVNFEMNYDYDNFQKNKKNVLIIGNSHGEDILRIFSYSKLTQHYYFYIPSKKNREHMTYQVKFFLRDLIKIRNSDININIDGTFLKHFNKQYRESDIIILATSWSVEGNIVGNPDEVSEISLIKKIHEILNEDDKKLIIIDKALMSKTYVENSFNRFDYFIYKNKRFPNQHEIEQIEKEFFIDAKKSKFVNQKLAKIANEYSIKIILRENIFCDTALKKCPIITNEGKKIYRDRSNLTKEGAKFFSNEFDRINFFDN